MAVIDIVLGALILFGLIRGLFKGLFVELASIITAFAITFVVIILLISLAGKALTKLADFASLGILNKLLGAVFGALKIGLILSVLLIVFDKMNNTITFVDEENIEDSLLYKPVKGLAPMIFPDIIKSDDETLDEDNDIIDPAE